MIITTTTNKLSLKLDGVERLWAFRAHIRIDAEHIQDIHYETTYNFWRTWELRVGGSVIPGVLVAGSLWTDKGWDFVYLRKPQGFIKPIAHNVLVIETDKYFYRRIIVSYDPEEATKIISWWQQARGQKTLLK